MSEEKKAWEKRKEQLFLDKKNGYDVVDEGTVVAAADYCEGYKKFLDDAKTEREAVKAAIALAEEQGFAQVLWLDGVEKKYVEEVGSMNIMFKIDGKIHTAPCTGTVLPGVTRRSCIELLKDWGYEVVEDRLAIADVMKAGHDGKLEEVFGCGTAAVVSPVKELDWKGDKVFISDGKIGEITQKLYDTMTGIQWGKIPDTKGWMVPVCQG